MSYNLQMRKKMKEKLEQKQLDNFCETRVNFQDVLVETG
jgi:hypothetical protein